MNQIDFGHDYFSIDENTKKRIVLCMKCGFPVKKPGYTKEQVNKFYKESGINWKHSSGIMAKGIVITCPDCQNFEINDDVREKIKKQIINALKVEIKFSGNTDEDVNDVTNMFNQMSLVGRI